MVLAGESRFIPAAKIIIPTVTPAMIRQFAILVLNNIAAPMKIANVDVSPIDPGINP